ncbi:MAG: glycosyltransferase [Ignavibacteriaceae bacterium]
MISASVIISFYNRIDYLRLVLAGLERQTFPDFEIIIADDGSKLEIIKDIELISKKIPFKLTHLWQEDKGFRKNKILNRSISAASSEYIIFIDGDCIPHSQFVREHFENRKKRICLTGRRVNLSKKITALLNPLNVKEGFLENNKLKLISDGIMGESFDVEKGFYFKNEFLRKYFNTKKRGLLGCNLSINKEDLLSINGFDERYEAPSVGEDTDIQYRLEQTGTKIISLNNIALQYHLYHKLQERPQKNLDLFNEVKMSGQYFTSFGIKKTGKALQIDHN